MSRAVQEITEVDNVLLSGKHLTDEEMAKYKITDGRAIEAYANFIKAQQEEPAIKEAN
jgi:hypothetical protein